MIVRLQDINPFDRTHVGIGEPPFFSAFDSRPGEHLGGALHCADLIRRGVPIRPIAICDAGLVPPAQRIGRTNRQWQRLDGFKRYWGHLLAGKDTIACVVLDEYRPGAQHGEAMTWAK